MTWDPETLKYTLILERHGAKLRIRPQMRVTKQTGETFLEPLAGFLTFANIAFDDLQIIDAPVTRRDDGASDLSLSRYNMSGKNWGRQP